MRDGCRAGLGVRGGAARCFAGAFPAALGGCDLMRVRSRKASRRLGEYGAGTGSRSIRFTLSSAPARSVATASGSLRAALAMIPIMKSVAAVDVPPAEMSGS